MTRPAGFSPVSRFCMQPAAAALSGYSGEVWHMSINRRKTIKISFSQDGENGFFTLLYSDNLAAGL